MSVDTAGARPADNRPDEVAILAPTGGDGDLAARVLGGWKLNVGSYGSMNTLCDAIQRGVGVAIVAAEALVPSALARLLSELDEQPAWSDVPIIILTSKGGLSRDIASGIDAVAARGNITLLERPIRVATMVTAVRSALRARERQYEVRGSLLELRAAREAADAANKSKSEFLAVMSHELRTPLNAISGYAELLQLGIHGPMTPEQLKALERIQTSQRHLLGLVNGVLNYARVEQGHVHYNPTVELLNDVLATCEELTSTQARARGLKFIFHRCPDDVRVHADREKTQQILLNLLSNAVKFTEPGGEVKLECEAFSEAEVVVRVHDTGHGIPAPQLERIFEPFVQVDARFTRTGEGVGLGLSISRDLARGMGGDLTVESVQGKGSTFTLALPRATEDE